MITPITSLKQFEKELESPEAILVFFWAKWAGVCRMIRPILESKLSKHPELRAFSVEVDEVPDVSQINGIRAMPTFKIFENGTECATMVGADARRLYDLIDYRQSSQTGSGRSSGDSLYSSD